MEPIIEAQEDQSQTTSQVAAEQPKQETDFKKMYYQGLGHTKKLETKLNEVTEKLDNFISKNQSVTEQDTLVEELVRDGMDEGEARRQVKIAQRLTKTTPVIRSQTKVNLPDSDPERDTFLQNHPEAYQFIDEIDNIKNLAPSRKYEAIAKSLWFIEPPVEQMKTFTTVGNQWSVPVGEKGKLTQEQEDAKFDEEVDILMGRRK